MELLKRRRLRRVVAVVGVVVSMLLGALVGASGAFAVEGGDKADLISPSPAPSPLIEVKEDTKPSAPVASPVQSESPAPGLGKAPEVVKDETPAPPVVGDAAPAQQAPAAPAAECAVDNQLVLKWADGTPQVLNNGDVALIQAFVRSSALNGCSGVDKNRTVTLKAPANAVFEKLPPTARTDVEPPSSLSADRKTMVINFGDVDFGSSSAIEVPVIASGPDGAQIKIDGTVGDKSASTDTRKIKATTCADLVSDNSVIVQTGGLNKFTTSYSPRADALKGASLKSDQKTQPSQSSLLKGTPPVPRFTNKPAYPWSAP